jgi:hypothetical protein
MAVRVSAQARLVSGLVLPWRTPVLAGGRRWWYERDSVRPRSAWTLPPVPLLVEHDFGLTVGRVVCAWSDHRGLVAMFAVSRSRRGDEALALAADPACGLSARVRVTSSTPDSARGVTVVARGLWLETSLTRDPACVETRQEEENGGEQ